MLAMKPLGQNLKQFVSLWLVVLLSAMVALTFADVVGRRLFNTSVFGANDLTEHLMAMIIFCGLPLLTAQRGHLSIDLLDPWLLKGHWRAWHKLVDVLIASVLGMIAQQFAVDYPARLRSLTLIGTHPGSPWAIQAAGPVLRLLFNKAHMSVEESLRQMRPHTYGPRTSDILFEEDALVRLANAPAARDYHAQLYGLIYWSVFPQLPKISASTLVLHGGQDALIPPENGRMIAARIPGASLVEFPSASHWLMTDSSTDCIATIKQHLKANRVSKPGLSPNVAASI
jgi:TRAP-type C4-dicarboxylate transport system permease small subunit